MEIKVSSGLFKLIPGFKLGIIEYRGITVGTSPQMVKGRLQLFQESLYFDLENGNVGDLPGVKEWRQIFKSAGKDPNRYRPSVEALMRRIQKGNYLTPVQSAIDLNNFFSLQYQVPIGIYDSDFLNGQVTIRQGLSEEEYLGLNGRMNSVENFIISADESGPFGSPFVDSDRTCVTEKTVNALQIVYLRPSTDCENAEKLVESLVKMFVQVHGGDGEFRILGC